MQNPGDVASTLSIPINERVQKIHKINLGRARTGCNLYEIKTLRKYRPNNEVAMEKQTETNLVRKTDAKMIQAKGVNFVRAARKLLKLHTGATTPSDGRSANHLKIRPHRLAFTFTICSVKPWGFSTRARAPQGPTNTHQSQKLTLHANVSPHSQTPTHAHLSPLPLPLVRQLLYHTPDSNFYQNEKKGDLQINTHRRGSNRVCPPLHTETNTHRNMLTRDDITENSAPWDYLGCPPTNHLCVLLSRHISSLSHSHSVTSCEMHFGSAITRKLH